MAELRVIPFPACEASTGCNMQDAYNRLSKEGMVLLSQLLEADNVCCEDMTAEQLPEVTGPVYYQEALNG